jgi:hypothetical protein
MSTDTNSARRPTWLIVGLACFVGLAGIGLCLPVVVFLFGGLKEGRVAGYPSWSSAEARSRNLFITSLKPRPDTLHLPEGTIRIQECWLEHEIDFEVGVFGWYCSKKTGRVICCITLAEGGSMFDYFTENYRLTLHPSDPPSYFKSSSTADETVFYWKSADGFDIPIAVRVGPPKQPGTIILLSPAEEE